MFEKSKCYNYYINFKTDKLSNELEEKTMNLKKIVAAVAAAAMAVTMTAVNTFAIDLNSEYTGGWSASAGIPKSEFEAIGGDVKVTIEVEQKAPLVGTINALAKPMNMCVSWDAITSNLTSDTAIAKGDGFFVIAKDQTTLEFVVPESVWSEFKGYVDATTGEEDGSAGLYFQVNDCILKSATLSAGSAEGEIAIVDEATSSLLMTGDVTRDSVIGGTTEEAATEEATTEEVATEVVEEAPAADTTTEAAATGNAPIAAMAVVMALAGAAAVATKKN